MNDEAFHSVMHLMEAREAKFRAELLSRNPFSEFPLVVRTNAEHALNNMLETLNSNHTVSFLDLSKELYGIEFDKNLIDKIFTQLQLRVIALYGKRLVWIPVFDSISPECPKIIDFELSLQNF